MIAAPSPGDLLDPIERTVGLLQQPITFVAAAFFVIAVFLLWFLLREKDRHRLDVLTAGKSYELRVDQLNENRTREMAALRAAHTIEMAGLHAESRDLLQRQTEAMLSYMSMMDDLKLLIQEAREWRAQRKP